MTESDAERAAREKLEAEKEALAKGETMADLKSLRSSMDAQFLKMNELLMALVKSKEAEATPPPPPPPALKEQGENSKNSSSEESIESPPGSSPGKEDKGASHSSTKPPTP